MRREIGRFGVLLLVAAGVALTARPAAALDFDVTATVAPTTAARGRPVTVTARIRRSDPQSANPLGPLVVDVSFLRVGDAKPFATRRVQLAANATADLSATWTAAAAGQHQFVVSVMLAPTQKLPANTKPPAEARATTGDVVVTAGTQQPQQSQQSQQPSQQSQQPQQQQKKAEGQSKPGSGQPASASDSKPAASDGKPAASSSSGGSTPPPTPTDAVPPRSTAAATFSPFVGTAPGIRIAGGPVPAAGSGGASAPAPFRPVTVTASAIRVSGGPVPPAGAVRPFSPVTVTAPPIAVRGQ
jgi:hypothetical protein